MARGGEPLLVPFFCSFFGGFSSPLYKGAQKTLRRRFRPKDRPQSVREALPSHLFRCFQTESTDKTVKESASQLERERENLFHLFPPSSYKYIQILDLH